MRIYLLVLAFYFSAASADVFRIDQDLVQKFMGNNVCLIVLRQPESINNTKKIVSSSRSPGFCMTPKGYEQISDLLPFLSTHNIFKIVTSSIYRSLQSTQIIADALRLSIHNLVVDDRLCIQNFGSYDGYSYKKYDALFPTLATMLESKLDGMESGEEVFKRTNTFLWYIANNVSNRTVLIITHALNCCHISKCLTDVYGELPLPGAYAIYDFSY